MSSADMFKEGAAFAASFSSELLEACKACIALESEIETIEAELSSRKKALNTLRTKTLPDAMAEAGLSNVTLEDGTQFVLSEYVSGSLPKDPTKRNIAIDWISSHGGEGLIKTIVTAKFEKKQHNEAIALFDDLKSKCPQVSIEKGIHAASLQAFIREQLKSGEDVPLDKLGVSAGPLVKTKLGGKA